MTLYPYSKITTKKLGLLLFAARAITLLGFLAFAVAFIVVSFMLISYGHISIPDDFYRRGDYTGLSAMFILAVGFACLIACSLVGGIAAALVAIESNLNASKSSSHSGPLNG
ncbi:hypothetical protein [Planctobacterium marinum]|uniref:Uncharacterized protein n=1 Tax=Planctobacterium marinum TaxID=1631968 RepID=A0AA48KQW6_9ALTE|nr:hypothetical protein MACH26_24240 [Planctobacterium marinum]